MISDNFNLRNYSYEDITELYIWRNNINTRKWLKNTEFIQFEEHMRWSLNRINKFEELGPLFMFERNTQLVGMTRLDKLNDSEYEVSIIVNPEFRNQGIGQGILKKTCTHIESNSKPCLFVAYIHNSNLGSIKIFNNSGFRRMKGNSGFVQFIRNNPNLV